MSPNLDPRRDDDQVLLALLQRLDEPPCLPSHLLEGFVADTLSTREAEHVHAHLRQCVVCMGALARLQSMHADEPALPVAAEAAPPVAVHGSTDRRPALVVAHGLIGKSLIGRSPALTALRDDVRRLLGRNYGGHRPPSILIQGDTGSGKGLLAGLLHGAGPRASGPFVDVNCAAIPETLLESELFGYEQGAFSGARRSKPGLFQTAHRGTIFLDEVGLLPEPLQAKLLKVLEERSVRRLGGTRSEPVDVWVMSASNVDLREAIRRRDFREDLYHRLSVLTLRLPSLRERGQDILLLANHFLARAAADYGVSARTLSADACARLMSYSWPGNVRELANLMERVTLLSQTTQVTAAMLNLPEVPAMPSSTLSSPAQSPLALAHGMSSAVESLDDAMADRIRSALEQTGWNLARTAAQLGVSRNTLRSRLQKLGLLPRKKEPDP